MYTKINNKLLSEIQNKNFTANILHDPEWEGGYDYHNRKIRNTIYKILNHDNAGEGTAQEYIKDITKTLNMYCNFIKMTKGFCRKQKIGKYSANSLIRKNLYSILELTIINQIRYSGLKSLITESEKIFSYLLNPDGIQDFIRFLRELRQKIHVAKEAYEEHVLLRYEAIKELYNLKKSLKVIEEKLQEKI